MTDFVEKAVNYIGVVKLIFGLFIITIIGTATATYTATRSIDNWDDSVDAIELLEERLLIHEDTSEKEFEELKEYCEQMVDIVNIRVNTIRDRHLNSISENTEKLEVHIHGH